MVRPFLISLLDGEWLTSRSDHFIPPPNSHWYPLDRRLVSPVWTEKFRALPRIEHLPLRPPDGSLVAILTEPSRLLPSLVMRMLTTLYQPRKFCVEL